MFGGIFKKNTNAVQQMSKVVNTLAKPLNEAVAAVKPKVESSSEEEEEEIDDTPEIAKTVDITIESAGGKGWPTDVSVVFYHKVQGLICVGTESGAVYSYGDGFQFMRASTREEGTKVRHIAALDPDMIVVAFSDNSIDVLELPGLNVVGELPSSWLDSRSGNITAVYVDEPGEKNYVYVGTSEGVLQVLDVTGATVRLVDFSLTPKAMGLSKQMAISDISLCPKDEKYIAVSFESTLVIHGAVVIFDLSKMKAHRVFETKAINTLAWTNTGDALFAGTKDGQLLSFNLDKPHFSSPWNATGERVDEDEEVEGADEPVTILKLIWMAPQPPSVDGCLFALLGCPGIDNEALKSVVVGLSPVGSHGELETVFSLPSIPSEKVLSYSLVPTYLKSEAALAMQSGGQDDDGEEDDDEAAEKEDALRATITPAVLLLTERGGDEDVGEDPDAISRNLKIVRCPAVDMATWALEVGDIAEPRLASEVLPGASTITCISGLVPEKSILSLSSVLIHKSAESEGVISSAPKANSAPAPSTGMAQVGNKSNKSSQKASRRLSTRDFFDLKSLGNAVAAVDDWEMVLAVGEHQEYGRKSENRIQDIIFKGYQNGTVVAWGVSLPEARGNVWLPLMSMRCGKSPVTCISHDENAGLLLAGDSSGVLVIWEVYEEGSGMSASEILRRENQQAMSLAKGRLAEKAAERRRKAAQAGGSSRNIYAEDGDEEDNSDTEERPSTPAPGECTDYAMYSTYEFNNCREVLRTRLHNHITATLLISQFTTVVVGTEDGTVYICTQFQTVLFSEIEHLDRSGNSGSVVGLQYGNFLLEDRHSVAAIYVAFANGHVGVVQLSTLQMVAYGPRLNGTHSVLTVEASKSHCNIELCLADGHHNKMPKPSLRDAALMMTEDMLLSGGLDSSSSGMSAHGGSMSGHGMSAHGSSGHGSVDGVARTNDFGAKIRQDFTKQMTTLKTSIDNSAQATARALKTSAEATAQALKIPTNNAFQTTSSSSAAQQLAAARAKIPFRDIPRYLIMLVGNLFLTYDLHKFTRVGTKAKLAGQNGSAVSVKVISQKKMVVSNFLWYHAQGDYDSSDEDEEGGALLAAAAVNAQGLMVLVSAKRRGLINHSQLVDDLVGSDQSLQFGCILPNGNCYLVRTGGEMVYTATVTLANSPLALSYPLPERISPGATAPKYGLHLLHGREALIASKRAAIRKRRTSVLKISSSPFDVSKIFSKTRAERQKEELIAPKEEYEDSGKGSQQAKSAADKASKTKAGLNETKEALQERGVKINRAALKADEMQAGASDFSKAAREQKEQLKTKNKRWGFF